jgi:hypothetical protein
VGHIPAVGREGSHRPEGQKASYVVFYKEIEVDADAEGESDSRRRLFPRATPLAIDTSEACVEIEGAQPGSTMEGGPLIKKGS